MSLNAINLYYFIVCCCMQYISNNTFEYQIYLTMYNLKKIKLLTNHSSDRKMRTLQYCYFIINFSFLFDSFSLTCYI